MTISLLVYGLVVAALIALAARALEHLAAAISLPRRLVWLGAMVLAIALPAWRAASRATAPVGAVLPVTTVTDGTALAASLSTTGTLLDGLAAARLDFDEIISRTSGVLHAPLGAHGERYLAGGWIVTSAALLLLLGLVERRARRRAESWPAQRIHGCKVHVSDTVGPAVVGITRPRIVVPAWLLTRAAEEQRAALAHEQSHVRAHDTWLLAGGCIAVALAPWNPIIWYMLARLRLTVEMDCDARVLRSGFAARSYGELLISVAEHASGSRPAALALSGGPSHLQRRIVAMTPTIQRFAPVRFVAACAVASLALLAACEAEMPTQADVSNLDASTATAAARKLGMAASDTGVLFFIDGTHASAAQASALLSDSISGIKISKFTAHPSRTEIHITTLAALEANGQAGALNRVSLEPLPSHAHFDTAAAERAAVGITGHFAATAQGHTAAPMKFVNGKPDGFKGLVLVDGVKVNDATLASLNAHQISSVRVIKGPAASTKYSDPAAAFGVIEITTAH